MVKAVLHFRAGSGFRSRVAELESDWLRIVVVDEDDDAVFAREMADAEVLLHVLKRVTADMINGAPRLRLIQKIGVGVNTIDLESAKARSIAVANMPGTNSRAVAELTLLLMMAALRRLADLHQATRAGRGWKIDPDLYDQVGEIAGRTVGLVGFGAIPRLLTPVLAALGANIIYTTRQPKADAGIEWRPLSDLLAESDIVSLHVPQTPETERMIDAAAIDRMKPGAVLVNTARGGLVDEPALLAALKSGRLGAAGLDVFTEEPVINNPLLRLRNVVVSPHVAWLTPETLDRSLGVAVENCRRLRDGEALLNRVQ